MRFSLLKKGSMVFMLSFLVMSLSLVSFSGLASAHHKEHSCKPTVKKIRDANETGAGLGGFAVHLSCLTPNATYGFTTNLPSGCPSVISFGHVATAVAGLGGHIDAFVTFGPSTACIPGDYTLAIIEHDPDDPGLVLAVPFEVDCCI